MKLELNLFDEKNVTNVVMYFSRNFKDRFWGRIEFLNGDLKGEKRFEAESFSLLAEKMQTFIDNLKE